MKNTQFTRRAFVGGLTKAMLLAGSAPLLLPRRLFAADTAPSEVIRVAMIGTGNQGGALLSNFLAQPTCRVVTLCDVYAARREAAMTKVQAAYGTQCAEVVDYAGVMADPGVDAVVIATPDHWHSAVVLAAVQAGKAVYCEKPLALSLGQDRAVQEAVNRTGAVFQYGTMQRSQANIRQGIELIRAGRIGRVERIEVWCAGSAKGGSIVEIPVPEGLDWDRYCGPSPLRVCTADRIRNAGSWYCSDYALGFIAGWGAHPLDVAILGTESDQVGPWKVSGTGQFPTEGLFDTAVSWDTRIEFADGVKMDFISHDLARERVSYRPMDAFDGTTFFGQEGWISMSRSGTYASDPRWLEESIPKHVARMRYAPSYYGAFLESVRSGSTTLCTVNDAVRSDVISHLANLVIRTGQNLTWDPKSYRIQSPEPLNRFMHLPTRGAWRTN